MDRRTFTLALGAGLLLGQAPLRAWSNELYAGAKREGSVTWYVAHYGTRVAELLAERFMQLYPEVRVDVVRATSQAIYQRLAQDLRSKAPNCDVFSSSDPSHYLVLKEQEQLLSYASQNLLQCFPELAQASDPDHYYTVTDVYMTSMVSGTENVGSDETPAKWTDMLLPRWRNRIALAHPGFSGDAGAWLVMINDLYGWEFLDQLAENKPFVARSIVDVPTTIGSGERDIGVAPPNYVMSLASKGMKVKPVMPTDNVGIGLAPSAILAHTQRPNASKLFLEYLSSREAGEVLVPEYRIPTRPDITPMEGMPTLATVTGYMYDAEKIKTQLPGLVEKWRDTFGV